MHVLKNWFSRLSDQVKITADWLIYERKYVLRQTVLKIRFEVDPGRNEDEQLEQQ